MQRDVYYAKARNYKSAIESALFPDNVPMSVYDNLIKSVHENLPALYRYYDLRRRKMKLKDIHHYDTYVPILSESGKEAHVGSGGERRRASRWTRSAKNIARELRRGMTTGRWCDRYPNQGKQSGAFSPAAASTDSLTS